MINKYRALIVDDEWLAREGLRRLLLKFPEIEVIGEADCISRAVEVIAEKELDVVFLDIQMPDESGFALFEKVDVDFKVIFVTAYDDFAIRAFEVNALDYLLKPINLARLTQAIARLAEQDDKKKKLLKNKLSYDDYIFANNKGRIGFVKVNTILYILAAGDYTEVFLATGEKRMVLRALKDWEEYLPEKNFLRIHRNTLINLSYVERVEPWSNSTFQIYLRNVAIPFTTSRKYSAELRKKFI
ncbi:MAG: LytTR family two component transcriptional regulator [bacterium]|nr:MAG: LytTR family two component transcriptional regulator [bacterium]